MVTQAQATAFACSLLAPLAPNLPEWSRRLRLPPSPAPCSLRSHPTCLNGHAGYGYRLRLLPARSARTQLA